MSDAPRWLPRSVGNATPRVPVTLEVSIPTVYKAVRWIVCSVRSLTRSTL